MKKDKELSSSGHSSLPKENVEYWPITSHTTQRQIEEWSQDEDNSSLYKQSEDERTGFLNYKYQHLGWKSSEYYFNKFGIPIKGKVVEQGAGCFWLSSYLSTFKAVDEADSRMKCNFD